MKRLETVQKNISGIRFYIRYFGSFYAAEISGDLTKVFLPILAALFGGSDEEKSVLDTDIAELDIAKTMSNFDGKTVRTLVTKLLIADENISFDDPETKENLKLDYDAADELFAGDLAGMFKLCAEVIKLNYGSFFGSLGIQSGNLQEKISEAMKKTLQNTGN